MCHKKTEGSCVWPMAHSFLTPVLKHKYMFFKIIFCQALAVLSWAKYFAVRQ